MFCDHNTTNHNHVVLFTVLANFQRNYLNNLVEIYFLLPRYFMKAIMSSDDYQVQNIYRYNRKSYKKNSRRSSQQNDFMPQEEMNIENAERSPRNDVIRTDLPGCSCDMDPEGDVANILHKKCPVITLAHQQLQRLLDETDKILCENTRCRRSIYDFLYICREVLKTQNKCLCALLVLLISAFFLGVFLGAASCGTHLGRFSSPIISCLDNLFISESTCADLQEYHGIV